MRTIGSREQYEAMYRESIADPKAFWAKAAAAGIASARKQNWEMAFAVTDTGDSRRIRSAVSSKFEHTQKASAAADAFPFPAIPCRNQNR